MSKEPLTGIHTLLVVNQAAPKLHSTIVCGQEIATLGQGNIAEVNFIMHEGNKLPPLATEKLAHLVRRNVQLG